MNNIPKPEYPRPDFVREEWLNLNGRWDFEFDDNNIGESQKWFINHNFTKNIIVPFCFESELSGIGDTSCHDHIWYKKIFAVPEEWEGKRILIHFGAVDYIAKVWINDVFIGNHRGGHTPFTFDITDVLRWDKNEKVVIKVDDISGDTKQARGKQTWKKEPFGCWYTRTSGIWQTVWLEPVEEKHIEKVRMTPDIDNKMLNIDVTLNEKAHGCNLKTDIYFKDVLIASNITKCVSKDLKFSVFVGSHHFEWGIMLWSPESPNLYDIKFTLLDEEGKVRDKVSSYFGMRKISVKNGKILLNNYPYYLKMILDQGYFPQSNLTAPDEEALIYDIKMVKKFGYNGVRKHQKAEEPLYLYWCDKLGLLVWGEMASFYEFNNEAANTYTKEWQEIIERDYNHPCIMAWTPFNESWGVSNILTDRAQQNYTVAIVNMIRSLDSTRLVISNDGWEHTDTDLCTIHDYKEDGDVFIKIYSEKEKVVKGAPAGKYIFAEGYNYKDQPILITEYGGIAFISDEGWGYGKGVKDKEEFLERFKKITNAIMSIDYICGFCYTQLTDVQQEVNGLLTYDRKSKIPPEKIREINEGK